MPSDGDQAAGRQSSVLSANELKRQLYTHLRSAGVVDSVKTQMRTNLLAQLQRQDPDILERRVTVGQADAGEVTLWRRVANSLIVEYLASANYVFTLSVFQVRFYTSNYSRRKKLNHFSRAQPECGLSGTQPLSREDILKILHLDRGTPGLSRFLEDQPR